MQKRNRFGLSRYVPQDVCREIRQRCGFGCVICGLAFYDYEHFDPDFKDARRHNPDGMTLLCSQCNQKRARGRLSSDTVARANMDPKCKQQGYASESLDFGPDPIKLFMGRMIIQECRVFLHIQGVDVLSIRPPRESGEPFLLSGIFTDEAGRPRLEIVDNVWKCSDTNWDVEAVGPRITIRRGVGDIVLQLLLIPPYAIEIEKLDMRFKDYHFKCSGEEVKFSRVGEGWTRLGEVAITRFDVALSLN